MTQMYHLLLTVFPLLRIATHVDYRSIRSLQLQYRDGTVGNGDFS